ncbi:MAG: hypothetical protein RL331_1135 [Bacteroidota bacterium]|jgi:hypothetical protein
MIRLFISLCCTFLSVICFAQQPYLEGTTPYLDYKTLGSMHLKGAVKQITETSYKATLVNGQFVKGAKEWQNTWDYDMVFVFDANGFLVTEKELRSGSYQVKRSTKIDSLKRVVQTTLGQSAHFYTYDSLGRISKSKQMNGETDVDKPQAQKVTVSYAFDAKGNWIRQYINDNGKLYIVERTIVYFS